MAWNLESLAGLLENGASEHQPFQDQIVLDSVLGETEYNIDLMRLNSDATGLNPGNKYIAKVYGNDVNGEFRKSTINAVTVPGAQMPDIKTSQSMIEENTSDKDVDPYQEEQIITYHLMPSKIQGSDWQDNLENYDGDLKYT